MNTAQNSNYQITTEEQASQLEVVQVPQACLPAIARMPPTCFVEGARHIYVNDIQFAIKSPIVTTTYVSASISAIFVTKSMSWAKTVGFLVYSLAPQYRTGKRPKGR